MSYCTKCGEEVKKSDQYCGSCGNKLAKEKASKETNTEIKNETIQRNQEKYEDTESDENWNFNILEGEKSPRNKNIFIGYGAESLLLLFLPGIGLIIGPIAGSGLAAYLQGGGDDGALKIYRRMTWDVGIGLAVLCGIVIILAAVVSLNNGVMNSILVLVIGLIAGIVATAFITAWFALLYFVGARIGATTNK